MRLARGPKDLICSARDCENDALWAVVWSNPNLHFGRTKTWLACGEHRDHLKNFLAYRKFPVEVIAIKEFLEQQQSAKEKPELPYLDQV